MKQRRLTHGVRCRKIERAIDPFCGQRVAVTHAEKRTKRVLAVMFAAYFRNVHERFPGARQPVAKIDIFTVTAKGGIEPLQGAQCGDAISAKQPADPLHGSSHRYSIPFASPKEIPIRSPMIFPDMKSKTVSVCSLQSLRQIFEKGLERKYVGIDIKDPIGFDIFQSPIARRGKANVFGATQNAHRRVAVDPLLDLERCSRAVVYHEHLAEWKSAQPSNHVAPDRRRIAGANHGRDPRTLVKRTLICHGQVGRGRVDNY